MVMPLRKVRTRRVLQVIRYVAFCLTFSSCCLPASGSVVITYLEAPDLEMGYLINPSVIAYDFVVGRSHLLVSELGIFDSALDGLSYDYDAMIWDSAGNPITGATIPQGVAANLIGDFRYTPLSSPATLHAGETYIIGAWYPDSADGIGRSRSWDIMGNPHFTTLGANSTGFESDSLAFPDSFYNTHPLWGPSFGYSVVPEPSSYALMLCGLAVLVFTKRRQRAKA